MMKVNFEKKIILNFRFCNIKYVVVNWFFVVINNFVWFLDINFVNIVFKLGKSFMVSCRWSFVELLVENLYGIIKC